MRFPTFRSLLLRDSAAVAGLLAVIAPAALTALIALTGLTGCESAEPAAGVAEDDLTSNTALARDMSFSGTIFVPVGADDWTIKNAIAAQAKSGFGALRTSTIGPNTRELKPDDVVMKSVSKPQIVQVIDTSKPGDAGTPMERRTYTFSDTIVVPKSFSKRSSVGLGLLNKYDNSKLAAVKAACVSKDPHDQDFASSSMWYVFNPSLSSCKTAMSAEQKLIDADKKKLKDPKNQVSRSEVDRLYLPISVKLLGNKTNKGVTYPEYDRLWSGGVAKGKLVIGMVNGIMADWSHGEQHDIIDDDGYEMWFQGLAEIQKVRPIKLTAIDGVAFKPFDLTVGSKTVKGVTWEQIQQWQLQNTGFPADFSTSDSRRQLRVAASAKIVKKWLTFQVPLKVKIGTKPETTVTLEVNSYFGAEGDAAPHKKAIKYSDVFIYNGHSYIGYGPLDPRNFSAGDFPSSYQIMFINSCVSFNYYEKDYWALKTGGTANLELITNGLESWVYGSGSAMGRFVATLVNGKQANYNQLLTAAQFQPYEYGYDWGMDALRVVDGELDNKYAPSKVAITIK